MGAIVFSFLGRAWRGEERLWKVWWLLGLVLGVLGMLLRQALERVPTQETLVPFLPTLAASALFAPYLVWCKMAWSSANNVDWKYWGIIAKILIALGLFQSVAAFIDTNLGKCVSTAVAVIARRCFRANSSHSAMAATGRGRTGSGLAMTVVGPAWDGTANFAAVRPTPSTYPGARRGSLARSLRTLTLEC